MKKITGIFEKLLEYVTMNTYKIRRSETSGVAHHVSNSGYSTNELKLAKHNIKRTLVDASDNLQLNKGDKLMDNKSGPVPFSCSYSLLE